MQTDEIYREGLEGWRDGCWDGRPRQHLETGGKAWHIWAHQVRSRAVSGTAATDQGGGPFCFNSQARGKALLFWYFPSTL